MAQLPPFPTFLIIGAERSATRWLRFNLDLHPEISAPPIDTRFFVDPDRMDRLSTRWYREQFEPWDGEPVVGEASASYTLWSNKPGEVARRIQKVLPDVRLIAIVRDPVERVLSAIRHHMRWGRLPIDREPFTIIRELGPEAQALDLIGGSIYFSSLYPVAARFGEQFQLFFHDDVRDRPDEVYREALEHVGVEDTTFVPPHLDRVLYSDRPALELPDFTLEQRQTIYAWFRRDVAQLEEWIGRDLSHWDPGVPAESVGASAVRW